MKKLFKLFGCGFLSGAACRLGSMLIDALFPKGLGRFLASFNEPEEEEDQSKKKKKVPIRRGG